MDVICGRGGCDGDGAFCAMRTHTHIQVRDARVEPAEMLLDGPEKSAADWAQWREGGSVRGWKRRLRWKGAGGRKGTTGRSAAAS